MRTKHFTVFLLLMGSLFTACSKSEIENDRGFEKSLQSWFSFKETSNDSYQYTVSRYGWPDHRSETVITVTNGKVTQRHYKNISVAGLEHVPKEALEWVEGAHEIGTHDARSYAADALTLDQIYEKARTFWLVQDKETNTSFEAKNRGMISVCGFSLKGCQDDCFNGINITSIEALKN
jgi:hypothetical protein